MAATFLIPLTLKASAVLIAAWLLTRAMTRGSAASRHLVWTLALAAVLAMPALEMAAPRWELAVLGSDPGDAPTQGSDPIHGSTQGLDTPRVIGSDPPRVAAIDWWAAAGLVWLGGVGFGLMRLAAGLLRASRVTRRAVTMDDEEWSDALDETRAALGVTAAIALKVSPETATPVACGIWTPTVLLPAAAASWPADRRRVVLLHEVAHVARRDCLVQAVAQLARALNWFNPLAYLAVARLRAEQERACDDLVLAAGTDGPSYADHLFDIARTFRPGDTPAWAALAMARPSQLEGRVVAILDDRRNRRPLTRAARAALIGAAAAVALPIGVLQLTAAAPAAAPAAPYVPEVDSATVAAFIDVPGGDRDTEFDHDADTDAADLPSLSHAPDMADVQAPNPNPNPQRDNTVSDETRRRVADALMTALADESADVREQAVMALASMRDPRALPGLLRALRDSSADVREQAAMALGAFRDPSAIDGLTAALKDPSPDVREQAAMALGRIARGPRRNGTPPASPSLPAPPKGVQLDRDVIDELAEQAAAEAMRAIVEAQRELR